MLNSRQYLTLNRAVRPIGVHTQFYWLFYIECCIKFSHTSISNRRFALELLSYLAGVDALSDIKCSNAECVAFEWTNWSIILFRFVACTDLIQQIDRHKNRFFCKSSFGLNFQVSNMKLNTNAKGTSRSHKILRINPVFHLRIASYWFRLDFIRHSKPIWFDFVFDFKAFLMLHSYWTGFQFQMH